MEKELPMKLHHRLMFGFAGFFAAAMLILAGCDDGDSPKTLASIAITKEPSKVSYTVGETLSTAGMEVTATYSDGSTAAVTDFSVGGFDSSGAGEKTVTVSYTEGDITKTASFSVTVNAAQQAKTLVSIAVKTPPDKTVYAVGENLNLTGLALTASYSDNTTAEIRDTTKFRASGFDSSGAGEKSVTVSYTEGSVTKTVSFSVRVDAAQQAKTLSSIAITTQPAKTAYTVGETLDTAGMEVTATYSDGSAGAVTGYSTSGFNSSAAAASQSITVSYTEGGVTKTASFSISISAAPGGGGGGGTTVPVSGVSLNKTTLTLTVGGSETLIATVAPSNASNKQVSWSSSNPSVAAVSSGTISAVAPGTATITVTTADGAKTAACTVTVNPAGGTSVPVSGVSLNKTALTLTVGSTETLTATVAPSTASNKQVSWSSSNPSVAAVSSGTISAVAPGTATITVTTADGAKTAACTVTVNPAGGTTGNTFNTLDALAEWLLRQPNNTAASPYHVVLTALDERGSDPFLYSLLNALKGKYVSMDLSGCTFTEIDRAGFNRNENADKLVEIILPASLTSIGESAFYDCTSLALTSLPAGITSIGNYAFSGCTSLALTSLPAGITSIGNSAFSGCTSLALTSLPAGITFISNYAFNRCTSLALTSLPAGITFIDDYAFEGCTSLALTSLPASLTSIDDYAFRGCTSLALTSLPASLTSIGQFAFSGCTSLAAQITLPARLSSIGNSAFFGCTSLVRVSFEGSGNLSSRSFGNNAFPEGSSGSGGNTLKTAYLAAEGGVGTYAREAGGSVWTKQ
jgi:predicted CoA-binding protein